MMGIRDVHDSVQVCLIDQLYFLVPRPTTPAPVGGDCPSDDWKEWGNLCYYFTTEPQPWDNAINRCREIAGEEYSSATLATIYNDVTHHWVYNHMKEFPSIDAWWIGLQKNVSG